MLQISPRDRTALKLLADGKAAPEIAGRLNIRECEIDAYLTALFGRMGAANRTEAIGAALRRGLLLEAN